MSRSTTSGRWARAHPRWRPRRRGASRTSCPTGASRAASRDPPGVVDAVVDDEHAAALHARRESSLTGETGSLGGLLRQGGQARPWNSPPLAGAVTLGDDTAAVHLGEASGRASGPDPQPPSERGQRPVPLGEEVEDAWQQVGAVMPMPVSLTRKTTSSPSRPGLQREIRPPASVYLAALVRRFTRICSSLQGVGLEPLRAANRAEDAQLVLPLLQERARTASDERR